MIYGPEAHFAGEAEVENETAFYGPEFIRTGLGNYVAIDGKPDVPAALGRLYIMHGITPETETSTHYFGFSTRNFKLDDQEFDDVQLKSDMHIRQQDVDAIEAVEARLEKSANIQRELLVRSDAPAVKVRQMIQAMLDIEASLEK
jgi:vanillate O-demethylase monooxygenase subunit